MTTAKVGDLVPDHLTQNIGYLALDAVSIQLLLLTITGVTFLSSKNFRSLTVSPISVGSMLPSTTRVSRREKIAPFKVYIYTPH